MPIDLDDRGQALENEYFHRREIELVQKMKEKLQAENAKMTEMKCPRCDGRLVETDFENVKIDVCENCSGAWLDAGELAQVVGTEEKTGWLDRFFG